MGIDNKSFDYTCIFGGGAIRGISYVGTLRALEELGICPNTLSGSSVGAIFASLLAVGYSAAELKDIFMHVNYELFRDIHFGFGKDFALSKGEVFLDWLRDLIGKKHYGESYDKNEAPPVKFKDLEKDLVIITTDLTNFKYKEFSKWVTPDEEIAYAVRVSATMPGLMRPAEYDGALLVDGDLQKSWPLWRLSENLCKETGRILEFRLEGDYEGKGQNPVNFMNTVYSCVTALATDFIMDTYAYRDKFDYIKINTGSVIVVDFSLAKDKRQELMDIGYQLTMDYFNDYLPQKKEDLINHYKKLLKSAKKIQKYVQDNKVKKAKEELGNLYIYLNSSKRFIDLVYLWSIEKFKDDLFENIVAAPLFGIFMLKNQNIVKSQINEICFKLNERIVELEDYIKAKKKPSIKGGY